MPKIGKRWTSRRQFAQAGNRPSCTGPAQSDTSRASTCGHPYQATRANASKPVTSHTATPEPRVDVNQIVAEADSVDPFKVVVSISYTVRQTNTSTNLVFPYYLGMTQGS